MRSNIKKGNKMKKLFALIGILGLLAISSASILLYQPENQNKSQNNAGDINIQEGQENNGNTNDINNFNENKINDNVVDDNMNKEEIVIPNKINHPVPFLSQSPFAKWDDLHNEACEEASLIMAKYWALNKQIDKQVGDLEIIRAVEWQETYWGGHYDLSVKRVVQLAQEFFGIEKIFVLEITEINQIKQQLAQGNLVITPMAGRLLENPYFRTPGPAYHMVLIRGYDQEQIITNDPGTKRGEGFKYSSDNFYQSLYDWPFDLEEGESLDKDQKAKEILNGSKRIIVVEK